MYCCWLLTISFCRRSSSTFRCELECFVSTKVGLAAGRYSGTSRPDLYLTPQALHSVFGPMGPVRHCGVLSVAQCRHFRPSPGLPAPPSGFSFFFGAAFRVFLPTVDAAGGSGCGSETTTSDDSGEDSVGERRRRREVQLQGAARDRLLRALAGTNMSGLNIGLVLFWLLVSGWNWWVSEAASSGRAFIPDISCSFWRSSLENDSSEKLESCHSSSAKSSYCQKVSKN